jgi:CspA family cold shock protein
MAKQKGTVKFFNGQKGYGFITPDDGGADIFVHVTAVKNAGYQHLSEGQKVSFVAEPSRKPEKGPQASDIEVLS